LHSLIKKTTDNFKVISGRQATAPFIDDVQKAADEHRNALGFFPKSVYEEFSRRGYLYVLVETTPNGYVYAGDLLFDCTFPRAKIVQMFTLQKYRRNGLATKLINHLKEFLTQNNFISIYARVAEDLVEANAYWDRQRFYGACPEFCV
jgi:GNAT superfamily N-acetyltransferase